MELTDFYKGNILPIGKYIIQLYLCYIICHVLYDYILCRILYLIETKLLCVVKGHLLKNWAI